MSRTDFQQALQAAHNLKPTALLIVVSRYEETMTDAVEACAERWIDIRFVAGSANAVRFPGYVQLRISEHGSRSTCFRSDQLLPPPPAHRCYRARQAACRVGVIKRLARLYLDCSRVHAAIGSMSLVCWWLQGCRRSGIFFDAFALVPVFRKPPMDVLIELACHDERIGAYRDISGNVADILLRRI